MTLRTARLLDIETGENAGFSLPAFVIDVAAPALVAANAAGWQAWGLAASHACSLGVAMDRAMPALSRLREVARTGGGEALTFWTARGLLTLRCGVETVASDPARFLVRALEEGEREIGRGEGASECRDVRHDAARRAPIPDVARPDLARPDLARLAHEVRTPLSAAIAYAEILKEEHFGPLGSARYREYARHVYDSARLALSVVDGTLARPSGRAGLPDLAFTDLDPAAVIDNCVAVARPLAERAGLDLAASYGPRPPRVIADELSLKQMLLNLVTNAIKFARPGDRVTLGAAYGADGCLRIEVADTGPGMPASMDGKSGRDAGEDAGAPELPLRSPAVAEGLGIGLPLTRALAEANGAALIVDSAPGRGTRVTIAFGKDRVVPV